MSIPSAVAALILSFAGVIGAAQADAVHAGTATTPDFLTRADAALAAGRLDRAVGLIVPRMRRLHRASDLHLAHATLCTAHLRQQNYTMAGETCALAAKSRYANGADMNNIAMYYRLTGDPDAALAWYDRAAQADQACRDERLGGAATVATNHR
jgi:hypothetical protein